MKKGFTLLELLIVVIVVAILATFAIPQYFKFVTRAKMAKAKHAVSLLIQAEKMYNATHDRYLSVPLEDVDGTIGTDVTGIDLNDLDEDVDFDYTVMAGPGAYIAGGNPKHDIGDCEDGDWITYDSSTGIWSIAECWGE